MVALDLLVGQAHLLAGSPSTEFRATPGLTPPCPRVAGVTTPSPPEPPAIRHTGLFIAVEGGDGAGKSTQVRLLVEALGRAGHDVLVTRQPGGTPLGASLRTLVLHGDHVSPRAEALLYAADKAQHVDTVIAPALAAGRVVVTDRYVDSAIAYQGAGRALGSEEVARLQWWAVGSLVPDLTILLDVDPPTGRERRDGVHDRLESEADDFHAAVREHFLVLAAAEPARYLVVAAHRPAEEIHAEIVQRLTTAGVALEEVR